MKEQTLMITGNPDEAFELLYENAFEFGDNGGDPDGNLWLPRVPLTKEDAGVEDVIASGFGRMVAAHYYDSNDMIHINDILSACGMLTVEHFAEQYDYDADETAQNYYDLLREALNTAVADRQITGWCGYGADQIVAVIWK